MGRFTRIHLYDSYQEVALKLAENDSDALTVLATIMARTPGPLGYFLQLDALNIYGPRIARLYQDVCHNDLGVMFEVLRACHFGIIPEERLEHAIDHAGEGLDVDGVIGWLGTEEAA